MRCRRWRWRLGGRRRGWWWWCRRGGRTCVPSTREPTRRTVVAAVLLDVESWLVPSNPAAQRPPVFAPTWQTEVPNHAPFELAAGFGTGISIGRFIGSLQPVALIIFKVNRKGSVIVACASCWRVCWSYFWKLQSSGALKLKFPTKVQGVQISRRHCDQAKQPCPHHHLEPSQ
jgi:hypothetical protein